jgi:hypothetical protein
LSADVIAWGGCRVVEVEIVVLPTERFPEGVRRTGRVDPNASLEKIKADVVKNLRKLRIDLGNPDDWDIAVNPQNTRNAAAHYGLTAGDRIILINREQSSGSSVEFD